MKIAYDGKRAIRNLTGLGNYSRLVIETMSAALTADDHLVYVPDMRTNDRLGTLPRRPNVTFRQPDRFYAWPKALWRSWGVTAQAVREGATIYHGLSNELPLNIHRSPIASVVTIHDVIYRRLPDCYPPIDRRLYDLKYGHAARHADHVIAISEATRRDVMELYGVPESRITVIRQGCSPIFAQEVPPTDKEAVRNRYRLPARYLVQIGTIEKRKNLETSLRALANMPEDIHLVAVGNGRGYLKEMLDLAEELGVRRRLHVLRDVPFADLPAIYRMALAALYPSRYEGFGIPVLEALTCGVPTVTSNVSSLPEAGGDAAFLVAPDDVRALTQAVHAIYKGGPDIDARRQRGLRHAATFAATDIADRIHSVYKTAIADHKKLRKS